MSLIDRESLHGSTGITREFSQDELLSANNQWAASITIVLCGFNSLAFKVSNQVVLEDARLSSNGSGSLGSGKGRAVTQGKDVRVLVVTSSLLVNVDPTGGITNVGFFDECRGSARWSDVNHVIVEGLDVLGLVVAENGFLIVSLDFDQFMEIVGLNTTLISQTLQNLSVVVDAKDLGTSMVIDDISLITNTEVAEGFLSQKGDLGRSTRALVVE